MTLGSSLGNSLGLGSSLIDATVSTRLWTPDDRDTHAWYDASETSSVTKNAISSNVSQWNDLSGNANHLTPPSGGEPGHGLFTQNGLPVMNFTGSDDDRALSSSASTITSGSQAWLCVAQIDAVTHGSESLFSYGNWQTGAFQFDGKSPGFLGRLTKDNNNTLQLALGNMSSVDLSDGDYHLFSIVFDTVAQQVMMRHDGDLTNGPVSDPNGITANEKIRIMVNRGENQTMDGQFCELVVLDDATATSVDVCEGYLAHKWGIDQKLPSKHPFDLEPPGVIEQGATEYLTDENGNIMMDENGQPIII